MAPDSTTACSWCGRAVEEGDGYRLAEPAGDRGAAFCRLEHVVPWAIQGPRWESGSPPAPPDPPARCSHCDAPLTDTRLMLVRHRGPHRIPDGFCNVDHLSAWAKAGGRWG